MPKWLQGMIGPTLALWAYAVVVVVTAVPEKSESLGLSTRFEFVSRIALSLTMACWVIADARKRGRPLGFDYGAFVFFGWPVVVPVYLVQTRGVRAGLTILCFAAIWLVAALIGIIVFVVRALLST